MPTMGCTSCSTKEKETICRVCELVDNDTTIKTCKYCYVCNSYICKEDWNNPIRRGLAAAKKWGII